MLKSFLGIAMLSIAYAQWELYRNSLKNQNFDSEQVTIAERPEVSENQNSDSSDNFDITAPYPAEEIAAREPAPSNAAMTKSASPHSPILEVRASYFRPFSKTLRELTGEGVTYGLETTLPVWRGWTIWGEVDYFSKSGTMQGIHHSVHITMVPITLGLKYFYYPNRHWGLYAGGGGKYYFVEEINRVFPMYKTTHRHGLGGVVEIGNVICINHFVIDIFSSWSFKKLDGPHHLPPNATSVSLQVGGWNLGMGLGYKF